MIDLRWLHFTDLHIGQKELTHGYWPSIRQGLLDDLKRTTAKLGPWDVVLFTGDLVFKGAKDEFEELDKDLRALWDLFAEVHPGAKPPILLAVPGNHDLARPDEGDAVAEQLLSDKPAGRENLWNGKSSQGAIVRGWFGEYDTWWGRCAYKPSTNLTPGLLPGDFVFTLEKGGIRFGFAGMNIAFAHTGNVNPGQLWLDPRQIQGACGGDLTAWAKRHHFAFLLTHHPPEWLAPEALKKFEETIAPPFSAHLCGHLHDARAKATRVGRGEEREIWQGTALFGMEKLDRRHGYTIGHLTLDEDGQAHTTLWPRAGVKRQDGSWAFTADVSYQLEEDLLATRAEAMTPHHALPRRAKAPSSPPPAVAAPKTWREMVETWPLWPESGDQATLDRAKRVTAAIVAACWDEQCAAAREVPADPWRDEDLPRRVLDRLQALLTREALSAEETALLLAAPFVREGLFAAGARWMEGGLKQEDELNLAHKLREEMYAARPDFVRRMEKVAENDRAALDHWLRMRALRQCPQLWEETPTLPHARSLLERIRRAAQAEGAQRWLLLDRLVQLARHVSVSADVFQAEESIDRVPVIEPDGVRLRLSGLARLLCAAGAWALDLRHAEDLVADHVGREGFEPATVREAIRGARWVSGKDIWLLKQRCADPVVDFVLRDDLVKRADQVLRRLTQDRDEQSNLSYGLLGGLPAQLRADIDIEKSPDGRAKYSLPHVRFQLDHNQVRELLMGEQLYGDPTLAIRELYQNALDACRYRKARVEYLEKTGKWFGSWEGRIEFRQDVDDAGRPYIECEDNGVGMTAGILEHVFAVAGRRFKDTPEYLEERARWEACKSKIELYPNSRFGIGVLSYSRSTVKTPTSSTTSKTPPAATPPPASAAAAPSPASTSGGSPTTTSTPRSPASSLLSTSSSPSPSSDRFDGYQCHSASSSFVGVGASSSRSPPSA